MKAIRANIFKGPRKRKLKRTASRCRHGQSPGRGEGDVASIGMPGGAQRKARNS